MFDPCNLGIKDFDNEWEIYASQVRLKMSRILGVGLSDSSVKERDDYGNFCLGKKSNYNNLVKLEWS